MSNKTRKRIWPVSLAAAIGVVAMLAVLAATMWPANTAQAQEPLGTPSNLVATAASATEINLTWNGVIGASSYDIERTSGGSTMMLSSTTEHFADTGLTASTAYSYRVRGVNTFGPTDWSNTATATTMAGGGGGGGGGGTVADGSPCDDFDTDATDDMAAMAATSCVTSSSTSASATVELKLVIESLDPPGDVAAGDDDTLAVGGSIVLYLEDDFAEPDDISASDVYFVSNPVEEVTGNGARVYATVDPVISNSDYFTADKDDIAIQIFVPDMCRNATTDCEGDNGLIAGDTISVVVTKGAGLKNASEEGTHSTGFTVLASDHTGSVPGMDEFTGTNTVGTLAKIGLSDVDNSRGYEMTVTGSGFNNGTTAGAYVLAHRAFRWRPPECVYLERPGLRRDGRRSGADRSGLLSLRR